MTVTITNQDYGCRHCYCGVSNVMRGSTTAGSPGGVIVAGICCKCGAMTEPTFYAQP